MKSRRPSWGISAAALLATLVAAGSLRTLLQGDAWWGAAAIVSAAAIAAAAAVRSLVRVRLLAPLAGVLVAVGLVLLLWVPGSLWWGLPTTQTVDDITRMLTAAFEQIYLDTPPATATPGIQLMVALGVALVAVLVDALVAGARLPWVAGLPLLLLAIVPGRAIRFGDDLLGVTLTALAFLLLVWLDRRRDSVRQTGTSAAGLAAAAVAVALVVQPFVPTLMAPNLASASALGPVFTPGVSPLLRLGDNLRQGADVVVLTYRTTATTPQYLRVATIDDFIGDEWKPTLSDTDTAAGRPVSDFPAPMGLSDAVQRREVRTTITTGGSTRQYMPIPYPAVSIDGVSGGWSWDPEALTVTASGDARAPDEYVVTSLQVEPTEQQLRAAPPVSGPGWERYLALPDAVPSVISETAREVTAGATTAYDRAVALQDWFRGPLFQYDENTPELNDGDGDSLDVIAAFLGEKRGFCIQFAAAMAVMARDLGIPARIAVGYLPGDRRIQQAGVFEVTSNDLHSWPELYFEGVGWMRFEPTPGRGNVPRLLAGAADAAPATPTPTPVAPAAVERPDQQLDATAGTVSGSGGPSIPGGILGAGVLVLLLIPGAARLLRRRRRLAALGAGRGSPAWNEVQDTAVDLGLVGRGELTPRALGVAIQAIVGDTGADAEQLQRMVAAVERERFARPGTPCPPLEEAPVRRILSRLRASAGRPARLRAALAPRSLLARRGGKLSASRLA